MSRVSPDEVILGLLARHGDYGYQLLEHFKPPAPLAAIWQLGTGQLYTILHRLEHRDEIDGREVFTADAPPRTEYYLTERGRVRLLNWLHDPFPSASTRCIRTVFLSRLHIAQSMAVDPLLIIESQREACMAALAKMQANRDSGAALVAGMALELKIAEQLLILNWLEDCEVRFAAESSKVRPT